MNIRCHRAAEVSGKRSSERGMAVIVMIAFLAMLLVYLAANVLTLSRLGRELSLLEQKQNRRLAQQAAVTNAIPAQKSITPASHGF